VLLLVLILVLIAFGLLVVALLSGSVLWAWVSVGVSVAAAAVLLVDWLQRRSAVRAGTEAGDALPPAPVAPQPGDHDTVVEPATEIIPAVRMDMPPPENPAGPSAPPTSGDERRGGQETVVLQAVAPPGSSGGPSGAHGGIGQSEPKWSQNVTNSEATGSPSGARDGDGGSGGTPADPDAEDTVKVTGAPGPADAASPRDEPGRVPPAGGPARGGPVEAPPSAPPGRGADLPPLGPDGAPPEEPRDADAAALVAGVDDEVLVVDELPRYHLAGCRSLIGIPVIPLPAREAVELGFTPCAWCTPDRSLSARHRAPAR
jgi:hypothetical protein